MPAYNFKERFADLVQKRIKRQTIRAERKDGYIPKVGDLFVGYSGMRTKNCRKLVESRISEVRHIMIDEAGIVVDGKQLGTLDANTLAQMDGFQNAYEMMAWFLEDHGDSFAGRMIRWL